MRLKVLLESNVGKNRKLICVTSSTLSPINRRAVVGLHAISSNDYAFTFLLYQSDKSFFNAFTRLGKDLKLKADDMELLEKYIRFFHGFPSVTKVNDARSKCF